MEYKIIKSQYNNYNLIEKNLIETISIEGTKFRKL
jgi:hypothetical protein